MIKKTQKITTLKSHKKGLMQLLFSYSDKEYDQ